MLEYYSPVLVKVVGLEQLSELNNGQELNFSSLSWIAIEIMEHMCIGMMVPLYTLAV